VIDRRLDAELRGFDTDIWFLPKLTAGWGGGGWVSGV
jgi:hypothetical protein